MFDLFIEMLPILMFVVLGFALFSGLPVAVVLGGLGLSFWLLAVALGEVNDKSFLLVISRIYGGVVANLVLVALPMFIFMGTMLERSGIARDLLNGMQKLTRQVPGGLAVSVVIIGVIMAASTGIIGASVVMMTLLALPVMAEQGYDPRLSTGTIAASGTLGILIPPSIMLVVMGDLLSVSVGTLFMAALVPGLMLSIFYLAYTMAIAHFKPERAPPYKGEREEGAGKLIAMILKDLVAPVGLILLVLGSIFSGIATPTEASGVGAAGAMALAAVRGKLSFKVLKEVVERSALTTAMLFGIFIGATAFSFVFALLGGHDLIVDMIQGMGMGPWPTLTLLLVIVFILGFFFDWVEITLIVLPIFAPIIALLDFGPHLADPSMVVIWFAILLAVNLQTSFLTPPFGFALFYMKGAAPRGIQITDIYKGIIPFVILQLIGLAAIAIWPQIALWLPMKLGL